MALPNGNCGSTNAVTQYKNATYWKTSSEASASRQYLQFDDEVDTWGYYNYPGSPEGNVAANIGSWCSDTTNGAIYVKTTDTVNTGWTSTAPTNQLITVTGQLTSQQIKNLRGTPIVAVAAPGSGKTIVLVSPISKYVYGGSDVFVAGSAQTVALFYGTATNIFVGASNGALIGTSNRISGGPPPTISNTATTYENVALQWYNTNATEISGNASNNNYINWSITYYIVTL